MRRMVGTLSATILLVVSVATPVSAGPDRLIPVTDGKGLWVAGPDAGELADGSSGAVKVDENGATITIHATGLPPGQAVSAWIAYFNDGPSCVIGALEGAARCGFFDIVILGAGGVELGAAQVVGGSGNVTFSARLNVGDGPAPVIYEPSETPDFTVIVRSKGPVIPGALASQLHGDPFASCDEPDVGPIPPGSIGGVIPAAPGDCGDVQVFVFETR